MQKGEKSKAFARTARIAHWRLPRCNFDCHRKNPLIKFLASAKINQLGLSLWQIVSTCCWQPHSRLLYFHFKKEFEIQFPRANIWSHYENSKFLARNSNHPKLFHVMQQRSRMFLNHFPRESMQRAPLLLLWIDLWQWEMTHCNYLLCILFRQENVKTVEICMVGLKRQVHPQISTLNSSPNLTSILVQMVPFCNGKKDI